MAGQENMLPCSPLPQGVGFFEVKGTPPDERRKKEKMVMLAAAQEPGILLLTPFAAVPTLEFDRIKLGHSGVRRLIVRNPGHSPVEVRLERLPKEEKGFNVDYVAFKLGGRQETTLLVGWTPTKGGGVRDSFIVKFGKFSTQVILLGSCLVPEEKKPTRAGAPPRPLGPKNTNRAAPAGRRPAVAANKLSNTKVVIPANPVQRKEHSPDKQMMEGVPPPPAGRLVAPPPPREAFVCGGAVQNLEISRADAADLRRETYVHERPPPRGGDVMESTPIMESRTETFRELRRETMVVGREFEPVGAMLPPPPVDPRRQTYVPERKAVAARSLMSPTVELEAPAAPSLRRSPGTSSLGQPRTSLTRPEALPPAPAASWTPQKPWEEEAPTRRTWAATERLEPACNPDVSGVESLHISEARTPELEVGDLSEEEQFDLSLSPKKAVKEEPAVKAPELADVLAKMMGATSIHEPLNLSLKEEPVAPETKEVGAEVEVKVVEATVEISGVEATPPRRYQPRVSDISQAAEASMASPGPGPRTHMPLRDPRLARLLEDEDAVTGALDLSAGSQLADCSLAVHCDSPARRREEEVEQELLAVAERSGSWEEEQELEMLAQARGTSAAAVHEEGEAEDVRQLSNGTVVLQTSSFHQAEMRVVREEEICTTEVVEEVVEYQYEVRAGEKVLVGERVVGSSYSSQQETVTRTPLRLFRHTRHTSSAPKEELGEYVEELGGAEEELGGAEEDLEEVEGVEVLDIQPDFQDPRLRPRSVDLTPEQVEELVGHMEEQEKQVDGVVEQDEEEHVATPRLSPLPSHGFLEPREVAMVPEVAQLPGLRGSPRLGHQRLGGNSFLQMTIGEQSFLPPSPDDPRRCSTGVKSRDLAHLPPSPAEDMRRSLQFDEGEGEQEERETEDITAQGPAEQQADTTQFAPINSLGFQLPVIGSPVSDECRLSSDTFVTSPAVDAAALSTIPEERASQLERSRRLGSSSSQVEGRTPLRPRRSQVSYTAQPIEEIAQPATAEAEVHEGAAAAGLLFIAISPTLGEKRKQEERGGGEAKENKKSRPPPRPAVKQPVLRVGKNPAPPKPAGRAPVAAGASLTAVKTGARPKVKPLSVPARPVVARAPQPARRLQLVKKATKLVHHPNPFASRNIYYDNKWVEKQERGFTRWLNFILTPQNLDEESSMLPGAVDVAKLWAQCSKDVRVPRAPTREVLSLRAYTARREMNRLRRAACKLWQSAGVAEVVSRLELEIDKLRLVIRKDRNINRDVGMKQQLLQLILSYNPLWLRVGLETVFGELLVLPSSADVLGLSRFLVTRLLSNPDILAEWAHPYVPHSYRDGYQDALNRFSLKKFLELVYFLDCAKEERMIRMNPCLFCPDSQVKSSKELLLTFSKDYLQGEGDVTKHLAYMGYTVKHKQTKLDEFDFAVTNFRVELRCGLRLARVAELLTGAVLAHQMRVPAISRTQKVHNTEVALKALNAGGFEVAAAITAKDLVDGHQEKTLQLLWTIIFGHSLSSVLDAGKLQEEVVHLRRSLRARAALGEAEAAAGQRWLAEVAARSPITRGPADLGPTMALLLEWAMLVTAHHGVQVDNWTVSWADGRGLCLLVHHYQPGLLPELDIRQQTTLTHQADGENLDDSLDFHYGGKKVDPASFDAFLENEKANFKLLISKVTELGGVPILIKPADMSNTIPDEKVTATFVGYLAARLLDLSREIKAARTIQLAWRRVAAVRRQHRIKVKYDTEQL